MAVYQPGQGLNEDALTRLRGRKDVNNVLSDMPAQDCSKQWDNLLGSGATKKLRCSQCTRPLSSADPSARYLLCQRCQPRQPYELPEEIIEDSEMVRAHAPPTPTLEPRFLHLETGCTETAQSRLESLPQTPSTEAAISEEDGEVSGEPSRASCQDGSVWAEIKQHLRGVWIGPTGEHYTLSLQDERHVLCMMKEKEDSLKEEPLTLFLDVRERLIWWGVDRSYFLDLTEKVAVDHLVWHDSGNGTAQQPNIEWKRISKSTGEASKTVRVKRWAKLEEAPEVPMPMALMEVVSKKNGSNKIRQVERQEAEVRPAKVIEPIEAKSMASKVAVQASALQIEVPEPAPEVTPKAEAPKEEIKQKVVPSKAKAETKLETVKNERKAEWKENWKEPSGWEESKASRSSSSGQTQKVIWRDWKADEANQCEQAETKVEAKARSWGWSASPNVEVESWSQESKRRVVPSPKGESKSTTAHRDTKQEVKVWKAVEPAKEEVKVKAVEAKEAKVWRPVDTPKEDPQAKTVERKQEVKVQASKEEVKSKLVESKQEAKVWRPVDPPKEESKAKSVETKQEAKVWKPVETQKEEVKAKPVEPKEAKVWRPVETVKEEVPARSAELKQEAKVWRPVETPKEDKARKAVQKEEVTKPKEAAQSSKHEVKVWRAVGEKDTQKADFEKKDESWDVRKDETFDVRKDEKWHEKNVEKKLEKRHEKKVEKWSEWEDEKWQTWEEEPWHETKFDKNRKDPQVELARAAIRIITGQVQVPENKGFVWVDEWQERFSSTLGTVREFLESRPDKFVVMPTSGRGYRVALVKNEGPFKWKQRKY